MELLDFIFRLGVLFAIYGFLWGLFDIGIRLLSAGRQRSLGEVYLLKAVKYFFLVDVTFLFCLEDTTRNMVVVQQVVLSGIILLTYFLGKLQHSQNRVMMINMMGRGFPQMPKNTQFNLRAEVIIIVLALAIFASFWFFPQAASNPISLWFHSSILNIENTPVFGFIFKVIGFFFLINLISKMVNAFTVLLSGGKIGDQPSMRNPNKKQQDSEDDFIDYEEVE